MEKIRKGVLECGVLTSPQQGSGALQAFPVSLCDPRYSWTYFDDFLQTWMGSAATNIPWIQTAVGSSGMAPQDGEGGWLKLYTGGSDNNSIEVQSLNEIIKLAANKPLWFEARFKVTDVLHSDFSIGLGIHDSTFQVGNSDSVVFRTPLDAGDGNLHITSIKDSISTDLANVLALVNDTFVHVGFYFDGEGTVWPYIEGTRYTAISTNVCDDEELAVTLCLQTNTNAAQYLYVDYVFVAQVR